MKISLIMCTRNRPQVLLRFVESLYIQTKQIDEFIIIDSSDISLEKSESFISIKEMFPSLIFRHTSPGLTYQRNIGVALVTGDIAFFFDDDIVLDKNYIKLVSEVFEKNPEYAGGMGQITSKDYSKKQKIELSFNKFFMLPHESGDGKFYPSGFAKMPHRTHGFLEVEVLSGGITAYKKQILQKYKFDEYFTGYGFMEDTEYSRRISTDYKLFYISEAVCDHLHTQGGRGNSFELGKMIARNYRYVFKKHFAPRGLKYKAFHLWSIIGILVYGIIFNKNIKLVSGYINGFLNPKG